VFPLYLFIYNIHGAHQNGGWVLWSGFGSGFGLGVWLGSVGCNSCLKNLLFVGFCTFVEWRGLDGRKVSDDGFCIYLWMEFMETVMKTTKRDQDTMNDTVSYSFSRESRVVASLYPVFFTSIHRLFTLIQIDLHFPKVLAQ
jgi:hypothetical protein